MTVRPPQRRAHGGGGSKQDSQQSQSHAHADDVDVLGLGAVEPQLADGGTCRLMGVLWVLLVLAV